MTTVCWRRTWSSLLPLLVLAGMLVLTGAFLQGSTSMRLGAVGVGALMFCGALLQKRTELVLDDTEIRYISTVRAWELDLSDVSRVDVPSNYRLFYVTLVDPSGQRRQLPILALSAPSTIAGKILEEVPPETISPRARETLRAIASGQRADQIIRWRQGSE